MRSVNVVFPESMCAEIPMLRIFSLGIIPEEHHLQLLKNSWKTKMGWNVIATDYNTQDNSKCSTDNSKCSTEKLSVLLLEFTQMVFLLQKGFPTLPPEIGFGDWENPQNSAQKEGGSFHLEGDIPPSCRGREEQGYSTIFVEGPAAFVSPSIIFLKYHTFQCHLFYFLQWQN